MTKPWGQCPFSKSYNNLLREKKFWNDLKPLKIQREILKQNVYE